MYVASQVFEYTVNMFLNSSKLTEIIVFCFNTF